MKTATEREKKDKFFSLNTKMLLIYSIRIRSDVKFTIYMLREKKKYEIAYTFNILRVFIVKGTFSVMGCGDLWAWKSW